VLFLHHTSALIELLISETLARSGHTHEVPLSQRPHRWPHINGSRSRLSTP
jgi:hypothetical protein